jgi:putative oxidoreductase
LLLQQKTNTKMTTKQNLASRSWHISLWIAQTLLAIMFLGVGWLKTVTPLAELSQIIPMAAEMPVLIRFIGVSELAGGLGLLLPAALRILPQLTIIAAGALAVVMLLAMVFHLSRGESEAVGTNIVLGALATFIAWGRSSKAPIAPRASGNRTIAKT